MDQSARARALAERISRLARAGRIIQLKPESGTLVALALKAFAAHPPLDDIVRVFCRVKCSDDSRSRCMTCIGLANTIVHLHTGSPIGRPEGT